MLLAVVVIYLTLTVGISLCLSKRVKSTSGFLIAGRKLGLLLTTATLAAIQLGAGVILGGAELGAIRLNTPLMNRVHWKEKI